MLRHYFDDCPLVSILRGVSPEQAVDVANALLLAGFKIIEVPLNSPDPLTSISRISEAIGDKALIGAGTVTTAEEVTQVHKAGGKLIFSPNCNLDVIKKTKELGMVSMPGCFTPSEMFDAFYAGADVLKLFPAEMIGPRGVKAVKAVLPEIPLIAVGGINNDNMKSYLEAGVSGWYWLIAYKPGKTLDDLKESAAEIIQAFNQSRTTL